MMPTPLRLLPPPALDPPYDDETEPTPPPVDGSLALALTIPPRDAVPLRLVPPATPYRPLADTSADDPTDGFGRGATPPEMLPDPRLWTRRLAQAIVEVLAGARAAGQLSRFASFDVLQRLERGAGRLVAPARRRPADAVVTCPRLVSVHSCEPRAGVIEASAVIDTGPRRRALALRLEGVDGRWQCTALELG